MGKSGVLQYKSTESQSIWDISARLRKQRKLESQLFGSFANHQTNK
jgi:hypothetical protein